jgi:hypothetical protein
VKADSPELTTKLTERFDGISAIEQYHQIGERKAILQ